MKKKRKSAYLNPRKKPVLVRNGKRDLFLRRQHKVKEEKARAGKGKQGKARESEGTPGKPIKREMPREHGSRARESKG